MKIKSYLLLLVVIPLFAFTSFHKYYVSVTQIDFIKEKKTIEITSRLFIDDFEAMLRERYDESITLNVGSDETEINAYLEKYLKSKFLISVNGEQKDLKFIGKEYEDDILYCYFEIEKIRKIKSFEVTNKVLFDKFEEQKNIVRTYINSKHKTFVLIPENHKGMLNF